MDTQIQTSSTPATSPQKNQSVDPNTEKPLDKTEAFKRTFFQILIGCLVAAAAIAVIAVLLGSFNEILGKALSTIVAVAAHAAISFGYIAETEKRNRRESRRSTDLFSNIVFVLVVLSFITSVFTIWELLGVVLAGKLYLIYGILLFATLHADVLYRIQALEKKIDTIVTINYGFTSAVVLMLSVVVLMDNPSDLGELFYRILSAAGIIDATMTITAIIMQKLYLQKHPEPITPTTSQQAKNFWENPLVKLLLIFLAFQVIGGLVSLALSVSGR